MDLPPRKLRHSSKKIKLNPAHLEEQPPSHPNPVRLAAVGDIHCTERSAAAMRQLFENIHARADVLLLCGDITDRGRVNEMEVLLPALIPAMGSGLTILAVLGNHDCHSGQQQVLVKMMREAGIKVLYGDDNIYVHSQEVGFVGVKGYWGGFSPNTISAFGEDSSKDVVMETVDDVRRLAKGLRSLSTPVKVAMLHYAPIKETLKGESPELMSILGAEWLAQPLDEEGASVCFHGHAHQGTYSGLTKRGVPVYNVAMPVLRREHLPVPSIHTV